MALVCHTVGAFVWMSKAFFVGAFSGIGGPVVGFLELPYPYF